YSAMLIAGPKGCTRTSWMRAFSGLPSLREARAASERAALRDEEAGFVVASMGRRGPSLCVPTVQQARRDAGVPAWLALRCRAGFAQGRATTTGRTSRDASAYKAIKEREC